MRFSAAKPVAVLYFTLENKFYSFVANIHRERPNEPGLRVYEVEVRQRGPETYVGRLDGAAMIFGETVNEVLESAIEFAKNSAINAFNNTIERREYLDKLRQMHEPKKRKLTPPTFIPVRLPDHRPQKKRVLDYMQLTGQIDPIVAWEKLGVFHLDRVIRELIKDHDIERNIVPVRNSFDERIEVPVYRYFGALRHDREPK